jgi:MFS family permease
MVGGILYGIRQWPGSVLMHAQIAAAATAGVMLFVPLVPDNTTLAIAAAAAGFCIAPTLIGLFTLTRGLVPARNVTEGLTWTNSGLATGFALGSAVAGILVDAYGPRFGLGTGLVGALCAAAAVLVRAATIGRNVDLLPQTPPQSPPAPAWNDDPVPGPHPDA